MGPGRLKVASASSLAAALLAFLTFLPATASAADCPNEAFRQAQGVTGLPSCMALEMVSPPPKALQPAFLPSFSLNGERVLYKSLAAPPDTPGYQIFLGDRYVATRTSAGWATAPTSPPASAGIFAGGNDRGGPYAFAPELDSWVLSGATQSQEAAGVAQIFRGGLDGSFAPISPPMVGIDNSSNVLFQFSTNSYTGTATSEDLSTTVVQVNESSISLLPGDPSGNTHPAQEAGNDRNSYVAFLDGQGVPHLELLARAGDGTVLGGRCGAHSGGVVTAAPGAGVGPARVYQGAISADGSRIFFSTRPDQEWDEATNTPPCSTANGLRVMQRVETVPGQAQITPISPELPKGADDLYQAASDDGTKIYLTTPRKLAATDADPSSEACATELGTSEGCDLYLYDSSRPPAERLTQVSAGGSGDPTPGAAADVLSLVTAISGDGSHAYFVAQGVLTTDPNPEGQVATAGQPNLYLYERDAAHPAGRTAFIATLSPADKGELWGTQGSFFGGATAVPLHGGASGGDGHVLFLASIAPLTADDGDGGHRDVFRYDAIEETLERISKPTATGGSDNGPYDVAVNPSLPAGFALASNFGERSRWASEDGETVAFLSKEALDPADDDGVVNPYFWKGGQLASVRAEARDTPALSPSGSSIAFATKTALLPRDRDTVRDVYVSRVDGGFPPPNEEVADCEPPLCQGGPQAAPTPPAEGSEAFSWQPPPPLKPIPCRKGFSKKHGKCVKRKHKRKRKRRAERNGGGRR